jgi:hypothetical protein
MSGFKVVTTTSVILIGWLLIDLTHGSSSDQLDCKSTYSLNSNNKYDITFDCFSINGFDGFDYMVVNKFVKNYTYIRRFKYRLTTNTMWCKEKVRNKFVRLEDFKEHYPDETYIEQLQKEIIWWARNASLKMSNISPEGIHHMY